MQKGNETPNLPPNPGSEEKATVSGQAYDADPLPNRPSSAVIDLYDTYPQHGCQRSYQKQEKVSDKKSETKAFPHRGFPFPAQ